VMIYHLRPQAFAMEGVRVDLFLVLSGYLITSIVLSKSSTPGFLPTFHARRALRILPPYYLCLMALVVVNPLLSKPFPMAGLPYYMTFTQNLPRYWGAEPPPFNWFFYHTWSLALEQQFYLIWPVVLILVGRRRLIPFALAVAAGSALARACGVHWWLLVARCDGFAIGSVIAVLTLEAGRDSRFKPERLREALGVSAVASLGLIVWGLATSPSWEFSKAMDARLSLAILGFNLLFGSLIGLIVCSTGHPSLRILRDRRLSHLGRVSYGLYLYHGPVFVALYLLGRRLGIGEPLWLEAVKLSTCVAIASLSWRYLEQPIIRWRERFRYSSAGEHGVSAAHPSEKNPRPHAPLGVDSWVPGGVSQRSATHLT
jgi:peptidoglycan/LPS O-acetylase OafA/YrhL